MIGEDFIIESDAEGRKMHREMVIGKKAKSINKFPFTKKLERDNKIKPIINDIKHIVNLNDEFLLLIK